MLSLRTNVARTLPELDRIAPLWNELLRGQSYTLFQSFSWNRLAAEMFRDRLTPYVVWMESDSGAVIIPAAISHSADRVQFLGEALFDYRDVLQAGDEELARLAWQEIAGLGKTLRVASIEEPAAQKRWAEMPLSRFATAPWVDRALVDEESFRLAHSRLGRQMRRLNKLGVTLHTASGKDSETIRHLYECKRRHFASDSDNLFTDETRCAFMVAAAELEGDRCETFTLQSESGVLVAGLVSFRDADVRRCYTIYFHPEWARYSPGVALLHEVTALSLGQGLSCDYMTGEYAYKLRLANSSRALYQLELSAQALADIAARMATHAA